MVALGIVILLIGLACMRLGRYLDDQSWGACGNAFAAGILVRVVGFGLAVVGVLRIVGVL